MSKTEMTAGNSSNVPAYLKDASASLGNENVSVGDTAIPEIKILHVMSGEMKKTSSKYIPDGKAGEIAVGKETFDEVYVINLFYEKEFPIFDDNFKLVAAFSSANEASDYISVQGLDPTRNKIVETAKHACLRVDENGKVLGPAIMRMSGSKIYSSNDWNGAIAATNAPRFASIWKLGTVEQSNAKGTWHNYTIDLQGYVDEPTFNFAKEQYESIVGSATKAA